MSNEELSVRSTMKEIPFERLVDLDRLGFIEKSKEYLQEKVFTEQGNGLQMKNQINFITGIRGSGKSTFLNFILRSLQDNDDINNGKKIIPVFFKPWFFSQKVSIYESFLDTLNNELLKRKFDKDLRSESNKLLNLLEFSGNWYISLFSHIFGSQLSNIEERATKIQSSISETYRDYIVVIVIDEIDRINKEDLMKVGKVINLIKQMSILNKKSNILTFYSVDSRHLEGFSFTEKPDLDGLNFYQYFNKFSQTKYDVYLNTQRDFIEYIYIRFMNVVKDNKFKITDKEVNEFHQNFVPKIGNLLYDLQRMGIPLTLRNIDTIFEEISIIPDTITDWLLTYEKTLPEDGKDSIRGYIGERIDADMMCHIIYFYAVKEKFNDVSSKLDSVAKGLKKHQSLGYLHGNSTDEKKENERKRLNSVSNYLADVASNGLFYSYMTSDRHGSDLSKELLNFIEGDYKFVREIIEKRSYMNWLSYVRGKYWEQVSENIMNGSYEISLEGANFLFERLGGGTGLFEREYVRAFSIRQTYKDQYNPSVRHKLYKVIIESVKVLLDDTSSTNRKRVEELIADSTNLIAEMYERNNMNGTEDSYWQTVKLSDVLNMLEQYTTSRDKKFIGFRFYLNLYRYSQSNGGSGYQNFEKRLKVELDKNLPDVNNFLLVKEEDFKENQMGSLNLGIKTFRVFEQLFFEDSTEKIENIIGEYLGYDVDSIESLDTKKTNNLVSIMKQIFYIIFESGPFKFDQGKIADIISSKVSLNYQFYILCRVLQYGHSIHSHKLKVYAYRYELNIAKLIYKNLKKELGNDFLRGIIEAEIHKIKIRFTYQSEQKLHDTAFILSKIGNEYTQEWLISEIYDAIKRHFEKENKE